ASAEREEFAEIQGRDVRGAGLAGEQCHLAEKVAGTEADLAAGGIDFHLAGGDEVNAICLVAGTNQALAGGGFGALEIEDEGLALFSVEALEEREAFHEFFRSKGAMGGGLFLQLALRGVEVFGELLEAGGAGVLETAANRGNGARAFF